MSELLGISQQIVFVPSKGIFSVCTVLNWRILLITALHGSGLDGAHQTMKIKVPV